MTRKLRDVYPKVFQRLELQLPPERDTAELKLGKGHDRRITLSEEEQELLKRLTYCRYPCLPHLTMDWLTYQGPLGFKLFAVLPDHCQVALPVVGLTDRSDNAAVLALEWGELGTSLRDTPDLAYEIYNDVFGIDGDYTAEFLRRFFEPLQILEVDPLAWGREGTTPYRVFGRCLLDAYKNRGYPLPLSYTTGTLAKIQMLIEDIPMIGQAVFRGITSTHWEHAFLEFYRCVERVYAAPYITALRNSLADGVTDANVIAVLDKKLNSALASYMEQHFTWRPKEEHALYKLLSSVSPSVVANLRSTLGVSSRKTMPVSTALYRVRNRIAHWRPVHDGGSSVDWDGLIGDMCELVYELYASFSGITLVEDSI